jgi:hypothetical protein
LYVFVEACHPPDPAAANAAFWAAPIVVIP